MSLMRGRPRAEPAAPAISARIAAPSSAPRSARPRPSRPAAGARAPQADRPEHQREQPAEAAEQEEPEARERETARRSGSRAGRAMTASTPATPRCDASVATRDGVSIAIPSGCTDGAAYHGGRRGAVINSRLLSRRLALRRLQPRCGSEIASRSRSRRSRAAPDERRARAGSPRCSACSWPPARTLGPREAATRRRRARRSTRRADRVASPTPALPPLLASHPAASAIDVPRDEWLRLDFARELGAGAGAGVALVVRRRAARRERRSCWARAS